MPRRTQTVEIDAEKWFDSLLEARQRIRTLVVDTDPEQATWSMGSNRPTRPEHPNRLLALALMGVHDLIEAATSGYIAELYEKEAEEAEEEPDAP